MSNVLTHHNDTSRTGANLEEVQLTASNVNVSQFGNLFTRQVDGQIYAQPLYLSNVIIPNQGIHNVVYVATMRNNVYAFDADDPNAVTPLWQRAWTSQRLGPPVPLQDPNIGSGVSTSTSPGYTDITDAIGILSTPVISLQNNALYVVAFKHIESTGGPGYSHWLHVLDLATGAEKFGGPIPITGRVPGSGAGSQSGTISFTSNLQGQRPGLLLANNTIYIAFASYADAGPYHGWVFAYNATTLQQVAVYNTTPNSSQGKGGIWQCGEGLAADSVNSVYFLTGNGGFHFNGSQLGDGGDCIVKLNPNDLTVADWFSPYNNAVLSSQDADLGSGGPLMIPNTTPPLLLGGGKEGKFYLVNTQNMGKFNPNNDNQIVQSFYVSQGIEIHGGPVYWEGPNGPWVYICPNHPRAYAWVKNSGTFNTTPVSQDTTTRVGEGYLSISANGGTPGTGILWVLYSPDGTTGILAAYDASDLSKGQLWNSEMNSARDHLGYFAKFCPPTVANGKVYVATSSGALVVYGLLSTPVNQMANLRLAFVANNSTNELLLVSSSKGFSWTNSSSANQASKTAPALAVFQNHLLMAFMANNSTNALLMCSSSDGVSWTHNTPVNQAGQFAPALAVFQNRLYMAFVANNPTNSLLICSSSDGVSWTHNTPVNQASKTAPALAVFQNRLYMAFVANNSTNALLICSSSDGVNWTHNTPVNQASKTAPALAVFENHLQMAFMANNPTNALLMCWSDGVNWTNNTPAKLASQFAPALAVY